MIMRRNNYVCLLIITKLLSVDYYVPLEACTGSPWSRHSSQRIQWWGWVLQPQCREQMHPGSWCWVWLMHSFPLTLAARCRCQEQHSPTAANGIYTALCTFNE